MRKIVFLLFLIIVVSSCSQQKMISLITKTPTIEYTKPNNFKNLNNYQKDGIYLVELIKQTYPRLETKTPNFEAKADAFLNSLNSLKLDIEFEIELKKFIAVLEDGHSYFNINFSKFSKNRFSIYLFHEKENWVIGNVEKSVDSSFIGKKIKSINGISISEIEKRINSLESGENKYWKNNMFSSYYTYPIYWKALNVFEENETLNLIVDDNGTEKAFSLTSKEKTESYKVSTKKQLFPFRFKQNNGFYYKIDTIQNFAYLQMNTSLDYVSIKDGIDNYTNFLTKPIALSFLKRNTKEARDFGKTLQSMFKEIQKNNIENLIIDLSYNTGGSEDTGKQLIWYLTEKQDIKGFTEYIHNSNYFKKQIKVDYQKYNSLYKKKFGNDLPIGEINITEEILNEPYFGNITKKGSPYLLDATIPKFKGKVYTIISPITFSAGQVLATTLSDNNLSKIIGKPTGNKPTTQTGASGFKLPNTKKIIFISYLFMERPNKGKNNENALYPDIEIYKTFDEFINGKDKVMEYILDEIKK